VTLQKQTPKMKNQNKHKNHVPVLAAEVVTMLDPGADDAYLDLTAGYGGHASLILERLKPIKEQQVTLVDRDHAAIQSLHTMFKEQPVEIMQADFLSATQQLVQQDRHYQLILADLGVSSPHLDQPERGFAFQTEGPLDMRMDQSQPLTAATILNTYSLADLTELIRNYGEEPRAHRIAEAIVKNRPLHTTTQLADIVSHRLGRGTGKIHPATKTFQALRIAVNSELQQLQTALPLWLDLLSPGGRIAVISFHSLEDRIVKQVLSERSGDRYDADLRLLTKTPVTASPDELVHNPRARSAKLRAAVKINK
jgi:16S rRNA (cytosine1402-N4)-methyltransferase